jgi:hypothetical protein
MDTREGDLAERLHYLLVREIIDTGHAPGSRELARAAGRSEPEVEAALDQLRQRHGVILEPRSTRVWSLHPFALNPTALWVTARERGWWANCAWCALGIGAAIGQDVKITTSDGAEGEALTVRVENGHPTPSDILVHFPQPPARWWDNPYAPCANILFFASEEKIHDWCARHGRPRGAVLDLRTAARLAAEWFGDYASQDWRRKTPEQASEIFRRLGLDAEFWDVGAAFR